MTKDDTPHARCDLDAIESAARADGSVCPQCNAIGSHEGGGCPTCAGTGRVRFKPLTAVQTLELVRRLRNGQKEVDRLAENARRFDSDWTAIRAELDETKRRLREAEAIVRDLAAGTPDGPASNNCVLCLSFYAYGQQDHHLPTCPYRRAVAVTRRES